MDEYKQVLTVHNPLVSLPQPLILNFRSDLDLLLRNGQRQLVAVHKLAKDGDFSNSISCGP